jgi:3-methyladenine DNA glycosylase AlkC
MSEVVKEKFSLKDHLFNKKKIDKIANEIHAVYPDFDKKNFIKKVINKFPELELKQRISWIREMLKDYLPDDFRKATTLLLKSLPPANDNSRTDDDFGDFIYAPYADFVAQYGRDKVNLYFSLDALKEMTMRFSAEDAIRYFINAYPIETLEVIQKWTSDEHYHVRRLASEGTRPKLPWAQKISIPVERPISILNELFSDKTRFVTRSVANHMNDISKTKPNLVLKTLKQWRDSEKQDPKEMDYIIKHSLRTLVKEGNHDAMLFLNFSPKTKTVLTDFKIKNQKVKIGESLEFAFTIHSKQNEKLLIDYTIYFWSKTGHNNNKKVFKLKQIDIEKNQPIHITKRHRMIGDMTTRKLHPGKHKLEIQINGKKLESREFELVR